ncbi:MAG TPA: DUF4129 domain-containing protein [Gemmatimonadales bacterium]|jgi:hypothetical protein|nr:DUF4129 domain-containing protein [Gemmatimonadales bacterium]
MQQDSLRAVLDSVFAAPAYRWVERPAPFAFLKRWLEGLAGWLLALRQAHPLGFRLFLAALVVALIAILVHAGWVLLHTIRPGGATRESPSGAALPRRDQAWYRREADRLAALGRYAEAMQADFLALVLALDRFQLLSFHAGKTPAEYTREVRLSPPARDEFRELVGSLYGYAFARWPCGPAEFAGWRARVGPERYARPH